MAHYRYIRRVARALPLLGVWGLAASLLLFAPVDSFARLQWETTEIRQELDLGQREAEAVFRFQNVGTRVVTIQSTSSDCGCAVERLDRTVYHPGEKGEIAVSFTAGQFSGERRNTIHVITDDPEAPRVALAYVVNIPAEVTVTPRLLQWRQGEDPEPKTVQILFHPEARVTFRDLIVHGEGFKTEVEKAANGRDFILKVKPLQTKSQSRAIFALQLEPDLENAPRISFFAHVR